mmetsp:Transcript_25634/g.59546  ORF Transcript_25634/g.59546 Transcript_25634/m.59546 type:complete len:282 (-) Transcript_25634:217-1062(-)
MKSSKLWLMTRDLSDSMPRHVHVSQDFRDDSLVSEALEAMVTRALALVNTCPDTALVQDASPDNPRQPRVQWKPEGGTCKLLEQKPYQSPGEWTIWMEKEILIWSGKLQCMENHRKQRRHAHHSVPMFLSRGILSTASPADMLQLFWDDSRTSEYNRFCVERKTCHVLQELQPHGRGTKVVQSETRVPFTKFSVVLRTLMHACPLQEGFLIASRSLCTTQSGGRNEMIWGITLLRAVPGHPAWTDLTCLSQVRSAMVPPFLTSRVGIMAIESNFHALRSCK